MFCCNRVGGLLVFLGISCIYNTIWIVCKIKVGYNEWDRRC